MLKICQYIMGMRNNPPDQPSIWSQLAKAVDLAQLYYTFVFDTGAAAQAAQAATPAATAAAAKVFQHFKDTTEQNLFKAMQDNPQLQYVLQPLENETSKRLPHLSYAWP